MCMVSLLATDVDRRDDGSVEDPAVVTGKPGLTKNMILSTFFRMNLSFTTQSKEKHL